MSHASESRSKGCLFYGCLTLVIVAIAGVIGGYFAVRMGIEALAGKYTSATPLTLPKSELADTEYEQLKTRLKAFTDALDRTNAFALTLTGDEINALITRHPDFKDFQGTIHVAIGSNAVNGTISIPLERFGWSALKGRYLNGKAGLKAAIANGTLIVTLDSLEVNGKPVPAQFMQQMRVQNLAEEVNKDPASAETFRKIESIDVKDGRLVIQLKGPAKE